MTDTTKTKPKRTRKPKAKPAAEPDAALTAQVKDAHAALAATCAERDALASELERGKAQLAEAVSDAEHARALAAADVSKQRLLEAQARRIEWKDKAKAAQQRLDGMTRGWAAMAQRVAEAEARAEEVERIAVSRESMAIARGQVFYVEFTEQGTIGGGVVSPGTVARNPAESWLTVAHRVISPQQYNETPLERRVGWGA